MTSSAETDGTGPDIVQLTLQRVLAIEPALSEEQVQQIVQIELGMKAEFGGQRVRIPKRRKHPSPEQRRAVFDEAVRSGESDVEIAARHGIGRATLYRYIKREAKG